MTVQRIDHVHIEVADRDVAAAWYERVLGLVRHAQLADWATDPMGPLILAAGNRAPALSLFARGCAAPSRDATIAFLMTGADFAAFAARLPDLRLATDGGGILRTSDRVDHGASTSFYFTDPDGNRLEVTCYDAPQARGSET